MATPSGLPPWLPTLASDEADRGPHNSQQKGFQRWSHSGKLFPQTCEVLRELTKLLIITCINYFDFLFELRYNSHMVKFTFSFQFSVFGAKQTQLCANPTDKIKSSRPKTVPPCTPTATLSPPMTHSNHWSAFCPTVLPFPIQMQLYSPQVFKSGFFHKHNTFLSFFQRFTYLLEREREREAESESRGRGSEREKSSRRLPAEQGAWCGLNPKTWDHDLSQNKKIDA